jgi:hypothetical protein
VKELIEDILTTDKAGGPLDVIGLDVWRFKAFESKAPALNLMPAFLQLFCDTMRHMPWHDMACIASFKSRTGYLAAAHSQRVALQQSCAAGVLAEDWESPSSTAP